MEMIEIIIGHKELDWLDDAIRKAMASHGYEYYNNDCVDIKEDGTHVYIVRYVKLK